MHKSWLAAVSLFIVVVICFGLTTPPDQGTGARIDRSGAKSDPVGQGAEQREVERKDTLTNSIGMGLIQIEPGEFIMGSAANERGTNGTETRHPVRLTKSFRMGRTEVTQEQWMKVMDQNPSRHKGDGLPVHNVTWSDATEFCKRLSTKEGRQYRLPTEAEWEYTCRAGTVTAYCFGDNAGRLTEFGWYNGNARGIAQPVATKLPNAWGLYDMHGNVREWCLDWSANRYPGERQIDPKGPESGTERVRRGGSCAFYAEQARSGARDAASPTFAYDDVGFRIVLEVKNDAS